MNTMGSHEWRGSHPQHDEVERLTKERDELLAFATEVRRTGDTRLASMAIAVINSVKGGAA